MIREPLNRGNGNDWKAVIVESSSKTTATLVRQLEAHGFQVAAAIESPSHAALEVRVHKAELLIIHLTKEDDQVLQSIEDLANERRDLHVIVTAEAADAELILRVLRAGASEFLVHPVASEELEAALDRVVRSLTPRPERDGEVIAVYSPKGGVGTTTVAVNLAFSIARAHKDKRVALVDTVIRGGDVPVFLDVIPEYTMADLLFDTERIDSQLLERVLHRYAGNVWVLPEPGLAEGIEEISSEKLARLMDQLRTAFDFVLVDCERQLGERTLAILDAADKIVLVTDLSVPAIRQLHRTFEVFNRLGYPERKINMVVNRHQSGDALRIGDVEKSLKHAVRWRLPNDYKAAIEAITRGKPLVKCAPRSKLTQSFGELAKTLNSATPGAPRSEALRERMRKMFARSTRR